MSLQLALVTRASVNCLHVILVLLLLDLIPPLDEMLDHVQNRRTRQGEMNVVPWHASRFKDADLVRHKVIDLLEVHDSTVVVILTWEECASKVCGVAVGEWAVCHNFSSSTSV